MLEACLLHVSSLSCLKVVKVCGGSRATSSYVSKRRVPDCKSGNIVAIVLTFDLNSLPVVHGLRKLFKSYILEALLRVRMHPRGAVL